MIQEKIINYFKVNPDLHALFVFDPLGTIRTEIEDLEWPDGYVLHTYDGRAFYVKYMLATEWKDRHVVLLFNEPTPGSGGETIRFPLLGELRANMEFCTEDYQAFMQSKGIPERFAGFIREHLGILQQSRLEKIMDGYYSSSALSEDVLVRGILSAYLKREELCEWMEILSRVIILHGPDTDNAKLGSFTSLLRKDPAVAGELSRHFADLSGQTYDSFKPDSARRIAEALKYNGITNNLSVTPGDNYKSYKLSGAESIRRALAFVEATRPKEIDGKFRNAFAALSEGIHEDKIIEWYGPDCEYMMVTDKLCVPIINAIVKDVRTAPDKAVERATRLLCRLAPESDIQAPLSFIAEAGLAYDSYNRFGTFRLKTPAEYIFRYKEDFYHIDQAYRHAIGAFIALKTDSPVFDTIHDLKAALDADYANWTGDFNREWIRCLNESGEKLISLDGAPHQHTFFKDNVANANSKVAVVISDALRFEVAEDLMQSFGKDRHIARLDYAIAMLPTETKYCKNALLPHDTLDFSAGAMLTDGKPDGGVESRQKQLRAYVSDGVCIEYTKFMKKKPEEKREFCKTSIIYIYHDVIDGTSHDFPNKLPAACDDAIRELHDLVKYLHSHCNVTKVFVTSDHGFLYNDIEFDDKDKQRITEETVDKTTRYYITGNPQPSAGAGIGISKYPLCDVSQMRGDGYFVAVPESTNRLYKEGGGYEYTHGGATLQELVIPIIESTIKKEGSKEKVGVMVLSQGLKMQSSVLALDLIQTEAISADKNERTIRVGVWKGDKLVTEEKTLRLDRTSSEAQGRCFHVVIRLTEATTDPLLTLKVYDVEDSLNPMAEMPVKNTTLIEQDF